MNNDWTKARFFFIAHLRKMGKVVYKKAHVIAYAEYETHARI